jgi:DNA-binding transcriptional ArsR family regulator
MNRRRLTVAQLAEHDRLVSNRRAVRGFEDVAPSYVQTKILDLIATAEIPPTYREIGTAVGLLSVSTVEHHVTRLEGMGYLRRQPGKFRTLSLTGKPFGDRCEHCHGTGRAGGDAS